MDKLQLIFFFAGGFLISRLVIKVRLPQRLFVRFIGPKDNSITRITFFVVAVSALLSLLIPNVITVLTLLPLLELLRVYLDKHYASHHNVPTILALATIYGANIGGMGSVTATPTNGILVSFAELNAVAGTDLLTFVSWLFWGAPLVVVMIFVAWGVIVAVFRPWRYHKQPLELTFEPADIHHPQQKLGFIVTFGYFLSCLVLSALIMEWPQYTLALLIVTALVTLGLIGLLFVFPFHSVADGQRTRLLTLADCYHDLPARGLIFVAAAVLLAGGLYLLGLNDAFSSWISGLIPAGSSLLLLLLVFALITSFTTEIFSNTAVQLGMFAVLLPLAPSLGFPPLLALLAVTLSCTCAFMSPIATGVNGLAFGGVRGASFGKMLLVGACMNAVAALFIALWVYFVVGSLSDFW